MNTNIPIEVGQKYAVRHSRKGTFSIKVTGINDEWISGEIIGGIAKAMLPYNVLRKGDSITIRDEHSFFTPLKKTPTT